MMLSDGEKLARLQKALTWGGNTHTLEDIARLVRDGNAQIWTRDDGCIVSEILDFPNFKAINFWLLSGALRDILALEDDVLDFAHREGCTKAIAMGRRGWGRAAASTGWKLSGYHFAKELLS